MITTTPSNPLYGVTRDQMQARQLPLPKGDLRLPDGRKMREIIGYHQHVLKNLTQVDLATRKSMIKMRGWNHPPTGFVVSASIGLNPQPQFDRLLHISMSYPDRDPSWAEIKMVRDLFFPPDVDCMMVLPRQSNWVNTHEHCFHLWQTPQEWVIG